MDGGYTHVSNAEIPAGYTYLAQFVLHDLTSSPVPRLDLNILYGRGPAGSPALYSDLKRGELREGHCIDSGVLPDLPRDDNGRALISDARNDLTIMIGQIHAAFIRFHNRLLADGHSLGKDDFATTRRIVTLQYHLFIRSALLPLLVDNATIALAFDSWRKRPPLTSLPQAFSLAAGRFGHSMVKPRYHINDAFNAPVYRLQPSAQQPEDLRGQALSRRTVLRWENFFAVGHPMKAQSSARINQRICRPLFEIPMLGAKILLDRSLPYRTLLAGQRAGLPSGQSVALAMKVAPLSDEELWLEHRRWYGAPCPLWYYILREADVLCHGCKLGPVGGGLFANVIVGALMSAAAQDVEQRAPNSVPDFPALLRFIEVA